MRPTRILNVALHNPTDAEHPDAERRVAHGLDNIMQLLDLAGRYDPDFVVFPEVALAHAARQHGILEEAAQSIPGPATEAVGEKARELDSYVVLPMYERDEATYYNAAALIGPDGDVIGTYRKLAPTVGEMDGGLTPGTDIPVWDTPFGRVGMLICWDSRYPRIGEALGRQGANLVLFPTHGRAHERLRTWALYHGFHVSLCDKNEARIYTPRREVVADVDHGWGNPLVESLDLHGGTAALSFAEINTDMQSYAKATARPWAEPLIRDHGGSIVFDEFDHDGIFVVESIDPDLPLSQLEAEYGMETMRAYEERTRERVAAAVRDSPILDTHESRAPVQR